LEETEISESNEAKDICIIIKNKITESKFCKLISSELIDFVKSWLYDFNLFKYECKRLNPKSPKITLSKSQKDKIRSQIVDKVKNIKEEYLSMKKYNIKEEEIINKQTFLEKKINEVEKISKNEIQKELRLEQLLQEDELQKQELEQEELRNEIINNKRKSEKLLQAIKEKRLEEKYNLAKYKAIETIKKIKEETEKQIFMRRMLVKKRFLELRKRNERKKVLLKEQILKLRGKMAENIRSATKKGDDDSCQYENFYKENDKIRLYCISKFSNELHKFQFCIKEENFCDICCENEFGDLYLTERELCLRKCKKNNYDSNENNINLLFKEYIKLSQ
jgi:hypothetical protein